MHYLYQKVILFTVVMKNCLTEGGGIMLALTSPLCSIRRSDQETNAELLVCEIRPQQQKKFYLQFFIGSHQLNWLT